MTKTQIEQEVQKLVNGYNYPIDIVEIAQKLGFEVYLSNFDNPDVAGMVINSLDNKSIYINKKDIPQRQRFTIAHEIGHIVLHHKKDATFEEVDYRNTNELPSQKEIEANAFAAALLMPKELAIKVWDRLQDVDDFADYFKVSKSAGAIRLMNLGLI